MDIFSRMTKTMMAKKTMAKFAAAAVLLLLVDLASGQYEDRPCPRNNVCIAIRNCQSIVNLLENAPRPIPASIRERLRTAQCALDSRGNPYVCCPVQPVTVPSNPTPRPVNTPRPINPTDNRVDYRAPPPDVTRHRNLRLLPQNCGEIEDDKIIGGQKTGVLDFPWMALLSYQTLQGPDFRCGGTIINERYILTAAHCISSNRDVLSGVRVGEHNIRTERDCEGAGETLTCADQYQDFGIEEILAHPEFDVRGRQNDIGLLRLDGTIDFRRNNVLSICLPYTSVLRNSVLEGRRLLVAGWGITETGAASPELLRVSLPIVANQRCGEVYNRSTSGVGYKQVCAGGLSGIDSCGGDSGGPLMIPDDVNNVQRYVQYGVVSYGPRTCGTGGVPGVYARVVYYMDWILNQLKR